MKLYFFGCYTATTQTHFCTAKSTIIVRSEEVEKALEADKVGVGQLFRFYDILPKFSLLEAGRTPDGFWRYYQLNSDIVRCSIREEFRADTFELHKIPSMRDSGRSWRVMDSSFGAP